MYKMYINLLSKIVKLVKFEIEIPDFRRHFSLLYTGVSLYQLIGCAMFFLISLR
jgi:hypothetical protein